MSVAVQQRGNARETVSPAEDAINDAEIPDTEVIAENVCGDEASGDVKIGIGLGATEAAEERILEVPGDDQDDTGASIESEVTEEVAHSDSEASLHREKSIRRYPTAERELPPVIRPCWKGDEHL